MIKTTREQRVALKRVFDRGTLYLGLSTNRYAQAQVMPVTSYIAGKSPLSYKEFRKLVQGTFGMDNAIVVPWCQMWLAIETDGYVHS